MPLKSNLGDLAKVAPAADKLRKVITLVSHGYSAPELFPGGQLTVLPWDLRVIEWMSTQQVAGIGRAELTRRMLARITGRALVQVDMLPLGEVNLVMMVSRALVWSDSTVVYNSTCPHCGARQKQSSIKIPDSLGRRGEKPSDYPGWDEVALPDSKDVVRVRPLLVGDSYTIESRPIQDRSAIPDLEARIMTAIVSVNGGEAESGDKGRLELHAYVRGLPPLDLEFLSSSMSDFSPGLDDRVPHTCDACGSEFRHRLNFDIDFFRS